MGSSAMEVSNVVRETAWDALVALARFQRLGGASLKAFSKKRYIFPGLSMEQRRVHLTLRLRKAPNRR